MKTLIKLLTIVACPLSVIAADLTGTWKAEFDTQIGKQKYTFTLKQDGTNVTGKASSDIAGEKHEVELKDGKLDGDTVAFAKAMRAVDPTIKLVASGATPFETSTTARHHRKPLSRKIAVRVWLEAGLIRSITRTLRGQH